MWAWCELKLLLCHQASVRSMGLGLLFCSPCFCACFEDEGQAWLHPLGVSIMMSPPYRCPLCLNALPQSVWLSFAALWLNRKLEVAAVQFGSVSHYYETCPLACCCSLSRGGKGVRGQLELEANEANEKVFKLRMKWLWVESLSKSESKWS